MGSEGVPSMVVEVMSMATVELTDASSWWHKIDDSPAWQDRHWLDTIESGLSLINILVNGVRCVVFIFYQNVQRLKLEIVQHILLDMSSLAFFTTYALLAHVVSANGLKPSFYTINIVVYVVQVKILLFTKLMYVINY
eukprot:XP_014628760.1 tobamovirus multiplication protein 3-like [Glycine max]